jgi:hypothetical protein
MAKLENKKVSCLINEDIGVSCVQWKQYASILSYIPIGKPEF